MKAAVFERALESFGRELADFDPDVITAADASRLFRVFTAIERQMAGARTLVVRRAVDSGEWRTAGHRSAASWVAETAGTGLGEAEGTIANSTRLQFLPETSAAVRRGELSVPQLQAITAAAVTDPQAEKELLTTAQETGLKGLREECRRVKARATSETEARARYAEIRKARSLRMWSDDDGVGHVEARLTADDLAKVAAAIRSEANEVFHRARRAGHREPLTAYEADAFVALVTGTSGLDGDTDTADTAATTTAGFTKSRRRQPVTMMHLLVDWAALRRGELGQGEVCEIPGVGPVPLAVARQELGEAILKVIITKGVDVTTVCHVGRAVPAHIRSALDQRDQTCVVPGCDVRRGLEKDHYKIRFEHDGPTELSNLARLCHWHHYLKTNGDFELVGEPGSWEWRAPVDDENPVLLT